MNVPPYSLPAHYLIPEPELVFHPERASDRDHHPLRGLLTYGPFSRSIITQVCDPIRVALITAHGQRKLLMNLLAEVERQHRPKERRAYLLDFPGFQRLLGVRVVPAAADCQVELPGNLESDLTRSKKPHLLLADTLTRAISHLQARRNEFDVVALVVPNTWEQWLTPRDEEDFDLHDYLKAVTAAKGLPLQILREARAFTYPCRCSVMWRLAIALYCKAGGIPWKLADTEPDAAYVGLSYALRPNPTDAQARFITCCSQVFDADGVGLEFVAYDVDDVRIERDNPFLGRGEMRRVMSRSLALYQRRNGGRVPKRVAIHKSTPFKPEEIEGCFDAWPNTRGLDLIQIQQDVMWRGVQINPPERSGAKGSPGRYPCRRGSYMQLDGRNVLLWTQGNVPMADRKDFFKEGKAIPAPLLLSRFAGHGPFDQTCREVLGLCKMNWNHDGLYDRLPVTMAYARVLARTVKRMPNLAPRPYQFRFLM